MCVCVCVCVCVCIIMSQINKEAYEKCDIEIIYTGGKYFWVNKKDLEVESDYENWGVFLTNVNTDKN